MSTNAAAVTPIDNKKPTPNHGFISGRIQSARRINTSTGNLYLTVLRLPAANEFAHPSTVELRSSFKLGEVNDDWSGAVALGGMPNNYETKDRDTDEKIQVRSARNEYTVLDV